ncbi:MAG: hypothetical protein ACTSXC_07195 [Candidatus Freyarchaeota archaeon]
MPERLRLDQVFKEAKTRRLMAYAEMKDIEKMRHIPSTERLERRKDAEFMYETYQCVEDELFELITRGRKTISRRKLDAILNRCYRKAYEKTGWIPPYIRERVLEAL